MIPGMAGVGMGATAAGGILSAFGAYGKGQADSNMYTYQSGVAQVNKQINLQNADYARKTGEVEAQASGMKTRQQLGGIVAAQSGGGLAIGKGSNQQVVDSQESIGEYDQSIIRSNAAKKAYGFDVEASKDEAQSQMDLMAAKQSRGAGRLGAITSLLGATTSVAGKWADASRVGIFK